MAVASINNSGIYGQRGKALQGMFGGSANAKFSNALTGTYSLNGKTYNYVSFLSGTSTLFITVAGITEVLVVGGGGGGGAGTDGLGGEKPGGAGGGGGVWYGQIWTEVGNYTVVVGAGGSAGSFSGGGGGNGTASSITPPNSLIRIPTISASGGNGGPGGSSSYGAQGNSHPATGTTVDYSGASTIYGKGQGSVSGNAPANLGQAGGGVGSYQNGLAGGSGIVIVRVQV